MIGRKTKRWMNMPQIEPPMSTPRLTPIDAISRVNRLERIRKNTPMGAILIKKVMTTVMIASTSTMARRIGEVSLVPFQLVSR